MLTKRQWAVLVLAIAFVVGTFSYGQAATKVKSKKLKAQVVEPADEPERDPDYIDPQQIKDALRQISDQEREIKRLRKDVKKVTKAAELTNKLDEIAAKLNSFKTNIKNPPADSTVGEEVRGFWEANLWEEFNPIRAQIVAEVELPRRIKEFGRAERELNKLLKSKQIKKVDPQLVEAARSDLAGLVATIGQVKALLEAGSFEEAQEEIQGIDQEYGPWDILGALRAIVDTDRYMKTLSRNPAAQQLVNDIIGPVIEMMKDKDYRGANQVMANMGDRMRRLFEQASQRRWVVNPDMQRRFSELEQLMGKELEKVEAQQKQQPEMVMPQEGVMQPQQ